ncbi:MAG: Asp-tRNA(Asn)/Glu-tRNA(Gln) amidotransferase subunit GatC [Bacteroidetes bacterium]|nr:Asp-tRNA(Asn)/Glu-tRNA(Gln) amidotransferase subunit GatC [Bacteroidota bacterium]MBU2586374.1 Asp-tRNA(Asn)/Glu-tRNA(Gln) amidotransferase subunit GatC [Bacteroidota bacterium]
MAVTQEEVKRIAKLAKLSLTEEEEISLQKELSSILDYMDKLNEIDTSDVEPLSHPIPVENVFREDKVEKSISREDALKNAPDATEEFFKVPKVI